MPSNPSQEREHPRSPMLSLPNYNSYFLLNDSYYSDSCDNDFLAFLYSLSSDISPSLIYFNFFSFWTLYKLNHSIFFCVLLCSHNMMFFTICIVSEAVVLASCLFLKKSTECKSLLLLYSVPLHGCTTVYFSILLLVDIWVVSNFCLLWIIQLWTFLNVCPGTRVHEFLQSIICIPRSRIT